MNEVYKCGICGNEYSTVEERMECEKKCIEAKVKQKDDIAKTDFKNRRQKAINEIRQMEKERDEISAVVDSKQNKIEEAYANFYKEFGDPVEIFLNQFFNRR